MKKVASPHHPIFWSASALDHVQRRHGIEPDEVRMAQADPNRAFIRAKRGRYLFICEGKGGRLLSLVVEPREDQFQGVTARPSTRPEIRLYRGR